MTSNDQLPRSTPEAQGISSAAILAFVQTIEQQIDALHSFMLLRHGQVVAEGWWSPYAANEPHMLFSLSKSFTSTAIGLAVAEGRLTVTDRVLAFFPEEAPAEVSDNLAAMRVHDLLAMATGHTEDTTSYLRQDPDGNWAKAFLARPVDREPGTHFVYNSGATYMLSAILQKITGMTLVDYLRPRLFDPLGIDYATWDNCPRGINVGGWGLWITTDSIARFGQLYLQQGQWQGQQLVPADWVAAASTKQVSNGSEPASDWAQGYGYQFWRCRHHAYRGDGAFGQYCIVMPEQDAVLAITSGLKDMQAPLNVIWEHLLPALGEQPLPADAAAHTLLLQKLATVALPPVRGASSSPLAPQVSGQWYHFADAAQAGSVQGLPQINALTLTFADDGAHFTLRDSFGEQTIRCGYDEWLPGWLTVDQRGPIPVAVSGAWVAEETFLLRYYFYQTPFCNTTTLQFAGDQVTYQARLNVSFGPTEFPQLVGRAA